MSATPNSLIQYYGTARVYLDYPDSNNSGINGDPAIADDRLGPTGKIWLFYMNSTSGNILRREIPYVGAKPTELGAPVSSGIGGRVNHFVSIGGEWYVGNVNNVYKFSRLDQAPTLLSTVSNAGQNDDQSFVANLSVDRHSNGTWYSWYSSFNGTTVGIRRATAPAASGPWTIEPGFWLTPSAINSSLNWLRIYHVVQDNNGNRYAIAGAGKNWGGPGQPDKDDEAGVWLAPVSDITQKPTDWQCIIDPPYFTSPPVSNALFNNAYAPTFIQDSASDWYIYVNTGLYSKERIVELRPNLPSSWSYDLAHTDLTDIILTPSYVRLKNTKAFIRDGIFKVSFVATALNYSPNSQYHTVHARLVDTATNEVLVDYQAQSGDRGWESRALPEATAIVRAEGSRILQVEVRYEVGSGQVNPAANTSLLRSPTLTIEKAPYSA